MRMHIILQYYCLVNLYSYHRILNKWLPLYIVCTSVRMTSV